MKKTIFALLLSISAATSLYSGAAPGSAEPEMYREGDEQNKTMVKESEFTKDKYTRGDYYNVGLGKKTIGTRISNTGEVQYINADTNATIPMEEHNLSQDYHNSLLNTHYKRARDGRWVFINELEPSSDHSAYAKASASEKKQMWDERQQKLSAAKVERRKEMVRQQHSELNYESMFVAGMQSATKGTPITLRMMQKPDKVHFMGSHELQTDTNVTNFYSQNYGYRPYNNSQTAIMNSNAEIIKKAYAEADKIEDAAKADPMVGDLLGDQIKCFISRELLPAYYCPFPSKNNVLFPDYVNGGLTQSEIIAMRKHSPDEALHKCDENCKIPQTCKSLKILSDTNLTFPSLDGKTIYPTVEMADGIYKLEIDDHMGLKDLSYTITVHPSRAFRDYQRDNNITFDQYLASNPLKLKYVYSLIAKPKDPIKLPEVIVNRSINYIRSSKVTIKIPINRQVDQYIFKFYKPFVYTIGVPSYKRHGEREFLKMISKITVDDIKGEFISDTLYYCPVRQFVNSNDSCDGDIMHINQNGQIYDLCLDESHKIGPDSYTGGFFTEGGCKEACFKSADCVPTYRHYTNLSNKAVLYKTKIGCVDDPSNIGCKQSYCEKLMADDKITPVDEIVIQNDNTRVYTIKHFDVVPGVPRPKVDVVGEKEAVSEEDFNNTFQKEMKDAAFQDMLNRGTYNRIRYKIGEESPEKVAHESVFTENGNIIMGKIKLPSFLYDNGQMVRIYAVAVLWDTFKAKYGQYQVRQKDGTLKIYDASQTPVWIRDLVWMNNENGNWVVFKRRNYDSIRVSRKYKFCPDMDPKEMSDGDELSKQEKEAGCFIQKKYVWAALSGYTNDKYVKYNNSRKDLLGFSSGQLAVPLSYQQIKSDTPIKTFVLFNTLERVLEDLPGAHIRDQITLTHGMSLKRVFDISRPYQSDARGLTGNVLIYMFSSTSDMSYANLLSKLNSNTEIYDHINRQHSRTEILHDGELNNKIQPWIMGASNKTTVEMKVTPSPEEYGKRAFKFIFIFGDKK